jgi:hypothetical protein
MLNRRKQQYSIRSENSEPEFEEVKRKKSKKSSSPESKQKEESQQQQKIKPIIISASFNEVKNLISAIKFKAKPNFKIITSNSTQVLCHNFDDKIFVINKLKSKRISFYTFTEPAQKPSTLVLKGFYTATCQEVHDHLVKAKIPAVKVTDFIRKDDFVYYLVHFENSSKVNIHVLNHNHRIVDDIVVKWDNLRGNNKKHTQCFNCQQWGHSSQNCGFTFKCVKCTDAHEPGKCQRITREGKPKCVNCGGDHAANHRGCKAFVIYDNKIKKLQSKNSSNKQKVFEKLSTAQFPVLSAVPMENLVPKPTSSSFAQKLKESSSSHESELLEKLSAAQEKFRTIPNIDKKIDIFIKMVDELAQAKSDYESIQVIMKYRDFEPRGKPPDANK